MKNIEFYSKKSKQLRKDLFQKFCETNGGHPGSVYSIMDAMTVLYYGGYLKFNDSKRIYNDKVIISKGHAAAALYPILSESEILEKNEFENWGKGNDKSRLRIFSNISIPGIDATSGSLGHGLGIGAGYALSFKRRNLDYNVYVVISEGELYEGSVWESLLFINHNKLTNLKIILDRNNLMILGNTEDCVKLNPIKDKFESFGFMTKSIDGHNYQDLLDAFDVLSKDKDNLNCLILDTVKGKGVKRFENQANWHYWQGLNEKEQEEVLNELS